jgi:opacity protein-like surface antigen
MKALIPLALLPLLVLAAAGNADAQEIRYSWLDMSFMAQDVGRDGMLPTPGNPSQIVNVSVSDGSGVRFRGSVGSWRGFYLVFDYGSTDVDLEGFIDNPNLPEPERFADEFDYTTIRGGVGFKYSIRIKTDLFGELTYDSLDFDFGSFAGENFDMDRQEPGATLGVRTLFGDNFQVQLHGRYSQLGNADLTTGIFVWGRSRLADHARTVSCR